MSDLLRKLGTLVRASIEGALNDTLRPSSRSRLRSDAPLDPADPRVAREIALLREEINQALDREEALRSEVADRQQAVDALSEQVDAAVLAKNEPQARRLLAEIRHAEQQITMLNADLAHHRAMTATLSDQVNILESQVAAARAKTQQPKDQPPTPNPADAEAADHPIVVPIVNTAPETETHEAQDTVESEDNLDERINRLARPDTETEEE